MFLEMHNCLEISAVGNSRLTCSRRINAQSSKVITSQSWISAHFSSVIENLSDTAQVVYFSIAVNSYA